MSCDYILCNWTLKSPSRDVLNKCMYVCMYVEIKKIRSPFSQFSMTKNRHHIFIKVWDKMFTAISRKTIESCMQNLTLTLVQCCGDIQGSVTRVKPQWPNFRLYYSLLNEKWTFSELITDRAVKASHLSSKRINISDSAFSKVEGNLRGQPSSKLSALSCKSSINQSSPGAKISNFSIDHILQTSETGTKSTLIHKAAPREESSSKDKCNNADFQLMEEDSWISHSSDQSTGKDYLQQDDRVITLILRKQKLNISAFQDVIASVHKMKAIYLTKFSRKRQSLTIA